MHYEISSYLFDSLLRRGRQLAPANQKSESLRSTAYCTELQAGAFNLLSVPPGLSAHFTKLDWGSPARIRTAEAPIPRSLFLSLLANISIVKLFIINMQQI